MPQALDRKYLYEVMFLVDPAKARPNENQTVGELSDIVARSGAELVNLARWADRELEYPMRKSHQKFTRAVYFLGHFNASGDAVPQIERMCRNADWVIRTLIIRDEDGPMLPGDQQQRPAAGEVPSGEQPEPAGSAAEKGE